MSLTNNFEIPSGVREKISKKPNSQRVKVTNYYKSQEPCVLEIDKSECKDITSLLKKFEGCQDMSAKTKVLVKIYDTCNEEPNKIGKLLDDYFLTSGVTTLKQDNAYRDMQKWLKEQVENEEKLKKQGGKQKSYRRHKLPKKKTRRNRRKSVRR